MREYELQMAWKFALLAGKPLRTTQGEELQIIYQGYGPSSLGGPDFTFAKLRINDRLWIGSVEVHIQSSYWFTHQHHLDEKYCNVILHVVWEHDREVASVDGEWIPTLQLKDYLDTDWFERVNSKVFAAPEIPCSRSLKTVSDTIRYLQLESSLVERLERRVIEIEELYASTGWDWDEALYRYLFRFMGQKVNNACMEQVAASLPYKIIMKHGNDLGDLKALLLGQAGFLNEIQEEEEHIALQNKYLFFVHKYGLRQPYNISLQWQYKGLRPVSFPKVKLGQLAYLIYSKGRLVSWMMNVGNQDNRTMACKAGKESKSLKGKDEKEGNWYEALLINAVIPFRMAYMKISASQLEWYPYEEYGALAPEKNHIVSKFEHLGFTPRTAGDTQGMLELYNNYCNYKKCLSCKIGHAILKKEGLL